MTQYQFNPDEFDLIASYTSMTSSETPTLYPADYSMEPNSCVLPISENQMPSVQPSIDLTNYYKDIDQRRQALKAAITRGEVSQNSCPGLLD
jgi:hypothetical protein